MDEQDQIEGRQRARRQMRVYLLAKKKQFDEHPPETADEYYAVIDQALALVPSEPDEEEYAPVLGETPRQRQKRINALGGAFMEDEVVGAILEEFRRKAEAIEEVG